MLIAVISALILYGCFVAVGALVGRFVLEGIAGPARAHATPILGMAATLAVLELLGAVLPIRLAVWALALPVLAGVVTFVRGAKRAPLRHPLVVVVPIAVAFVVGLVPLFIAGRATAAAMTNDDGTYYITVADRLLGSRWFSTEPLPEGCLRERVLHVWNWRTGVSNLMAAFEAVARQGTPASLGVLTVALYACIPSAAVLGAIALGAPRRPRVHLVVGVVAALSAAPVFLAYQHLTGQLAAFVFFPLAAVALARALVRGGLLPTMLAGLALGASTAVFADGGAVLVVIVVGAIVAARRLRLRALSRAGAALGATALLFPMTIFRAVRATWATVDLRLPSKRAFFPQQGWLPRSLVTDGSTVVGVDPWPPWPLPSPLGVIGVLQLAAVAAALVLVFLALRRSRRRAHAYPSFALLVACVLFVELRSPRYLVGKSTLMLAAFVVPLVALGVSVARRFELGAAAVTLAGMATALAQLLSPERFFVVDEEHHDRLVTELSTLPPGSLLVLDGFGAPMDRVHDEHRAFRAGLLAHLLVVQPGLDGGFYKPRCADPTPFLDVPPHFYALQRKGAENLSQGAIQAQWGPFTLRRADAAAHDAVVGAWAPTVGWLAAEVEPSGSVFRWGAAETRSELWFMQSASCAHLHAEARTLDRAAELTVGIGEQTIFTGAIGPVWSPISTGPIAARATHSVSLSATGLDGVDPARAYALRNLRLEPTDECVRELRRLRRPEAAAALPEDLVSELAYSVLPAGGTRCGRVTVQVEASVAGRVAVRTNGAPTWTPIAPPGDTVVSAIVDLGRETEVVVSREAPPDAPPFRVTALKVTPTACPSH